MKEADILNFVRSSIGSVWALEMLLLVGDRPERAWPADELVRGLRSSPAAANRLLSPPRFGPARVFIAAEQS